MSIIQLLDKFRKNQSIVKDLDSKLESKKYELLIGDYRIIGFLGEGTFGKVYKGIHVQTSKKVAIKLVNIEKLLGKTKEKAIRQKYKKYLDTQQILMKKCHSAFIVKLYKTFENSKCKIFVMEYCRNGGLDRYLNRCKGLEEQEAINILRQIILGLSEMHRNNIVHRDLSPANIFIHNGIFKIGDFGYGRLIEDDRYDQQKTICGNKCTMAPQVRTGKYNLKADIWSLGMTYFMMLYSKCPLPQRYFAASSFIENEEEFDFRTVSGAKISSISVRFLRQTLQQDVRQRLDWQKTLQHQLFRVKFERLSQIYLPGIREVFDNLKGKRILRNDQIQKQQAQNMSTEVDWNQQIDTNKINEQYLQCRIAQFILHEIVDPIQRGRLLDLEDRLHLEFMFLLLNRCRENIIVAKETIKREFPEQIGKYFSLQMKQLEKSIFSRYVEFEQKLKKAEDKITEIISDKIMSLISHDKFSQKQKFLTHFERQSFSKGEQIDFTLTKYIKRITKKLEGNRRDVSRVKRLLWRYKQLNEIKLQDLQGRRIQQKVSEMLQQQ